MDFPVSTHERAPFPWRTAALVAVAVAAVELVVLLTLTVGPALVAGTESAAPPATKDRAVRMQAAPAKAAKAKRTATRTAAASLPRRKVEVVVLNGNGRQGAAAAASSRIRNRGYRIALVGNAPSHDYPRSLVMYRPGFAAEGKRLGRDLGIRLVSPLDGMRPSQLHGAHTVVILGS